MSMQDTPLHLIPIEQATVEALCNRAMAFAFDSYTVRLEVRGFRDSCTPWDAMRLANSLAASQMVSPSSAVDELIGDLDRLAHERAALVPMQRRRD